MVADEFILNLDSVGLNNKNSLPEYSGIYYVVDADKVVWYIGRSVNLWQRWNAEQPHHRYHQLIAISNRENKPFYIYYSQTSNKQLYQLEKAIISKYQPRLNNTPVITKGSKHNLIPSSIVSIECSDINKNKTEYLKILSNGYKRKKLLIKDKIMIENSLDTIDVNQEVIVDTSLKQFKRKFITLRDDETGLNLQLEICINSKGKLYVRHYTLYIFYNSPLKVINSKDDKLIDDCLSTIHGKCQLLYKFSIKWLGYKLDCEDILLIDEEEELQIETPAIMLRYNLFVDLVEYIWLTDFSLPKTLEEQEKSWYRNQGMPAKIAKWLHDNKTNLHELVEGIE